jgi:hypothetical protein
MDTTVIVFILLLFATGCAAEPVRQKELCSIWRGQTVCPGDCVDAYDGSEVCFPSNLKRRNGHDN